MIALFTLAPSQLSHSASPLNVPSTVNYDATARQADGPFHVDGLRLLGLPDLGPIVTLTVRDLTPSRGMQGRRELHSPYYYVGPCLVPAEISSCLRKRKNTLKGRGSHATYPGFFMAGVFFLDKGCSLPR
ncbi:hypothetical protein N7523_008226 [Penicillium sp. IBT 18751x]|nr:hypothetical protein N7523_008226 [Penicillium sp. IBT 18751x]